MSNMNTPSEAKAQASKLREILAHHNHQLKHTETLEVISKLEGYADWNTYSAHLTKMQAEEPAIRTVNMLLTEAASKDASEVHVERLGEKLSARYYVDSEMIEVFDLPQQIADLVIARIKHMAKIKTGEHLPQDGNISLQIKGQLFVAQVSTQPLHNGEQVVMRLLKFKMPEK